MTVDELARKVAERLAQQTEVPDLTDDQVERVAMMLRRWAPLGQGGRSWTPLGHGGHR